MDNTVVTRPASWYEASARERIAGLLDPASFEEFLPPSDRVMSPHLTLFDLPPAFDDGVVIGRGTIEGFPVLLAAQEGRFMGGTFAEVSGAKMLGLIRGATASAQKGHRHHVVLALDSGGVRLQEANAGEMAVSEIIRAICDARAAGLRVIALVGGRAGAFGGAGLIAATCESVLVTRHGRTSVSGPEVIETNKGVEEFDSKDRGLVWRVTGGRTRALCGGADLYVEDHFHAFKNALREWLARSPVSFTLQTLEHEQQRLERRLNDYGDCRDATEIWAKRAIPPDVADLREESFSSLLREKGTPHNAR